MDSSHTAALDLSFRGKRTYIQGSLIISKVLSRLAECSDFLSLGPQSLAHASFRETIDYSCNLHFSLDQAEQMRVEPAADLKIICKKTDEPQVVFVSRADSSVVPPRLADTKKVTSAMGWGDKLCCSSSFNFANEPVDGLFRAIVETQKANHEHFIVGAKGVKFLGLFGSDLPCLVDDIPTKGHIDIKNLMLREHDGLSTTISQLTLTSDTGVIYTAKITFSSK